MKIIVRMLAVAAAALFLLGLAACSDKEADSLERVRKAGEISFAMSGGYPPFNFYSENNELVGFDVDVAREVASRLGVALKPVTTEWSGIIEGLRSGVYDGILGSMAVTEERLKVVNFSIPYYYSGAQLMVKKDAPFSLPDDLRGKIVGVVTGTTFADDAARLGVGEVKLYKDDTQTLTELSSGVVDGVITDRVVGVNAMNSERFDIVPLGAPLRSEDIAVAFNKSDATLLDAVNQILTDMHEDGTLARLSVRWLNADITAK
ncbi:transporter substrate-binding domain-containing protein [Pseudodesulfovibrio sp. F-1]|uniref:Transporter substrate-binding domain-containing protein n=1 Tax=Pseudodesulfovibrio alkaliphilus TaxID=2661613 RepID=A0A7K1KRQ0_9BACT|nr:ABC transporter substrate-binding protein [Pseudodesulfovibrio alkaliphilus]MUM78551.1 transporter substrate-binding domain-containing protein [Pseudodesulfovibrio alkaliphilus]